MPEKVKKHTHVTPRVYLRRFAADGLLIAERTGCEPEPIGVPEVAVRKRFYTLKRSDGTSSNEVENSLGILETKVTAAFKAIDRGTLPLDPETKAVLAEFIGVQMTRGVRYRELRSDHVKQNEDWLRERVRELFSSMRPLSAPPRLTPTPAITTCRASKHGRAWFRRGSGPASS